VDVVDVLSVGTYSQRDNALDELLKAGEGHFASWNGQYTCVAKEERLSKTRSPTQQVHTFCIVPF
jgi:hypothetical protein